MVDGCDIHAKMEGITAPVIGCSDCIQAVMRDRDGWKASADLRQATCDQLAKLAEEWKHLAEAGERSQAFQRLEQTFSDACKDRDEWKRKAEEAEGLLSRNEGRVKEIVDEKLLRERDALAAALRRLYEKCNKITAAVGVVFSVAKAHGIDYDGPQFTEEMMEAERVLGISKDTRKR